MIVICTLTECTAGDTVRDLVEDGFVQGMASSGSNLEAIVVQRLPARFRPGCNRRSRHFRIRIVVDVGLSC